VGAGVLYLIASGKADFSLAGGFASNGYGEHSPGKYSYWQACLRSRDDLHGFEQSCGARRTAGTVGAGGHDRAGFAAYLASTYISIPSDQHFGSPPRAATGSAIVAGGVGAPAALGMCWVAPLSGPALLRASATRRCAGEKTPEPAITGRED
jgi:aquaporin Z